MAKERSKRGQEQKLIQAMQNSIDDGAAYNKEQEQKLIQAMQNSIDDGAAYNREQEQKLIQAMQNSIDDGAADLRKKVETLNEIAEQKAKQVSDEFDDFLDSLFPSPTPSSSSSSSSPPSSSPSAPSSPSPVRPPSERKLALEEKEKRRKEAQERREANAQLRILENTPGSPEHRAKVFRQQNLRQSTYDERLDWARANRGHPLGKAIIRAHRNKSVGGRMLNRVGGIMRGAAITVVLGAIGAAVNAAVKFLSRLPGIADDITKMANKGFILNLTEGREEEYKTMSKILGMGDNGEGFMEALGSIHKSIGSFITGSPSAALDKVAALSSKAGGSTINEIVKYSTQGSDNTDAVMNAAINDVFRASFRHQTVLRDDVGSFNKAFHFNALDMDAAFGIYDLLDNLGRQYQALNDTQKAEVQRLMNEEGKDAVTAISKFVTSGVPTTIEVSGGNEYTRAQEVAVELRKLKTLYENVRDGILIKILAALEPIVEWLRMMLKGVLGWLNKNGPEGVKGTFTEFLYNMNAEDRKANFQNREINKNQMALTEYQVKELRDRYGFAGETTADQKKREDALENFKRGILPEGMTWEQAKDYFALENLFAYQRGKEAEFSSPDALSGLKKVSAVTPTSYGVATHNVLAAAGEEFTQRMFQVIRTHGIDINRYRQYQDDSVALEAELRAFTSQDHQMPGTALTLRRRAQELTGGQYGSVDDALADMANFRATVGNIIDNLPLLYASGQYDPEEIRRNVAASARIAGEETTLRTQINEAAANKMGAAFLEGIKEGKIEFVGTIEADKREYTIILKNERGEVIQVLKDQHNPNTTQTMIPSVLYNDRNNALDASRNVPTGTNQ